MSTVVPTGLRGYLVFFWEMGDAPDTKRSGSERFKFVTIPKNSVFFNAEPITGIVFSLAWPPLIPSLGSHHNPIIQPPPSSAVFNRKY